MIQSVGRAIEILRCFENERQLGLTEISRRVGLHKSTTAGLVNTLQSYSIIEQDKQSGKYQLGIELVRLGSYVQLDLRDIGSHHVQQIMESTGETANLMIYSDASVIYIDKRESSHSMRICTTIGQRLPMYCTAGGKAILASMSLDEQESIIKGISFERYTKHTIKSINDLRKQLNQVLINGYALDYEELEYELVCVGVAVHDAKGVPQAALSVSGPKTRMTTEKIEDCYLDLKRHADMLSREAF